MEEVLAVFPFHTRIRRADRTRRGWTDFPPIVRAVRSVAMMQGDIQIGLLTPAAMNVVSRPERPFRRYRKTAVLRARWHRNLGR